MQTAGLIVAEKSLERVLDSPGAKAPAGHTSVVIVALSVGRLMQATGRAGFTRTNIYSEAAAATACTTYYVYKAWVFVPDGDTHGRFVRCVSTITQSCQGQGGVYRYGCSRQAAAVLRVQVDLRFAPP